MAYIKKKLLKIILFLQALIQLKSFRWSLRLAKENFSLTELHGLIVQDGNLTAESTGITVSDIFYPNLKGGLKYWRTFAMYRGVSFFGMDQGKLVAIVDDTKFNVENPVTLFILAEVFAERLYDLRTTESWVVLDIGMNVGVASLFLASLPQVKKVYGFEPLKTTFNQAMENFKINPLLNHKISAFQKGISNYDGEIEVPGAVSGSAIFSTDKDFLTTIGKGDTNNVSITIQSIEKVMGLVATNDPGNKVMLKLDCEGEEYKIMDLLDARGLLEEIDCIALEWHFKGHQTITEILIKNGYTVFNLGRTEINPPVGMLYAFK